MPPDATRRGEPVPVRIEASRNRPPGTSVARTVAAAKCAYGDAIPRPARRRISEIMVPASLQLIAIRIAAGRRRIANGADRNSTIEPAARAVAVADASGNPIPGTAPLTYH